LHVVQAGNQKVVELDSNGDKKADFSIALDGNPTITSGDFLF
jgi:hypothetical protein